MIPRIVVLAFALLAAGSAIAAGSGDDRVRVRTGVACKQSTGEPLYREVHEERWEGGRIVEDRVTYSRPGGETFATKRVDFRADAVAPDFEFVDSASGHREALARFGDALVVRYRAPGGAPERSASLASGAALVADAGFDRFIERSWDRLMAGEAVIRPFLIPSRLRSVDMRIRRLRRADEPQVEFELAIDSALLRLVVPAIRVHYDASTRRLLRYEGISNLRGANGRNLQVTIEFSPGRRARWSCGRNLRRKRRVITGEMATGAAVRIANGKTRGAGRSSGRKLGDPRSGHRHLPQPAPFHSSAQVRAHSRRSALPRSRPTAPLTSSSLASLTDQPPAGGMKALKLPSKRYPTVTCSPGAFRFTLAARR